MEPLSIHVLTVKKCDHNVRATVRASAKHARIRIELQFVAPAGASREDLWQLARDQALRYLDPA